MVERQIEVAQQSPLGIIRSRIAVKRKEMRRFICGVITVALIVGAIMSRAIISGVIEQYHISFSDWSLLMYVTQGCMIILYTAVFTALLSVPLWYFFLGEEEENTAS